ncbi:MAG: hypothetical protein K0R90_1302, partial [Oscillospiraceae bacterium]|nr:hypothetical protein [Oscillospiraceae bacterium]
ISMVVPQLAASIYGIAQKTPDYINNLKLWADGLVSSNPDIADLINGQIDNISKYSQELLTKYSPMLDGFVKGITKGVFSVLIGTKNFMIGIIISIYIMASKEKFLAQSKKIIFAFFSRSFSTRLIGKIRKTNTIFSGFVTGQIIDAFIVATLCFICLSIFKIPYALLVSVLIGVTNIIPFFGPFIGAIPSAIIIFMENPMKSLFFVIIILIIQQVDGNVINPRILGESTGLSAFWVIFAILIAGGLFGFVGMFVGVPTFAVIYTLIRSAVEERLEKKGLPTDTNDYKKPNPIPKIE